MANSLLRLWRPAAPGTVAAALAVVGLAVAGVAILQPAQATPVPTAQANCPPPVDPRPISVTTAAFARIDGIKGDETRPDLVGQIPLTAIRSGLIGGGSGLCGGAAGHAAFDPVVVEKRVDRASVLLLKGAAEGARIPSARLSVWTENNAPRQFLTYDLSDVTVQYVRQVWRGDSLTEEVALGFAKITWSYTPQNANGSTGPTIQACWDRMRNSAC